MTKSAGISRRGARRATRVSRQLEAIRRRNSDQLAEERAREQRVEAALRDYVSAGERIADAEESCRGKVEDLRRRIEKLRSDSERTIAGDRRVQARAVLTVHAAGRTIRQVAELLDLSLKATRLLIERGREVTDPGELAADRNSSGAAGVPSGAAGVPSGAAGVPSGAAGVPSGAAGVPSAGSAADRDDPAGPGAAKPASPARPSPEPGQPTGVGWGAVTPDPPPDPLGTDQTR